MNKFNDLVKDQWAYGGKKYASTATKESTDILVDDYGFNWLLGTLNKYIYRYKNLGREKDLLKIACYCFIMWLKFGFHLNDNGTASDNYTTVESKAEYWDKFVFDTTNLPHDISNMSVTMLLESISDTLKSLRLRSNISKQALINVFHLVERVWILDGFDKKEVHDCDTWIEGKDAKNK